jgi:hypothetical protein
MRDALRGHELRWTARPDAPLTGMLLHAEDANSPRTLSVLEEPSPDPSPPLTLRLSPRGTPESELFSARCAARATIGPFGAMLGGG